MKEYLGKTNARTITRVTHGLKYDGHGMMQKTLIYVRITKDDIGASLSLSTDQNTMLMIPLEPVGDIIGLKGEIAE